MNNNLFDNFRVIKDKNLREKMRWNITENRWYDEHKDRYINIKSDTEMRDYIVMDIFCKNIYGHPNTINKLLKASNDK